MNNPKIPDVFHPVFGLGTPRGYFPVKNWNRWGSLFLFILFIVGALLVFLLGIYDTCVATQQHGPAMIDDRLTVPLAISIILFILGLLAGWKAYANWNKGAATYERGVAYNDWKGLQVWRWDEVVSMTSAITSHYTCGIHTGTTHHYTLSNPQKQRLVLSDSISHLEELANEIDQNIFSLLYGPAADQYNAGQQIAFGPVAISKGGIALGKKTCPWADVKELSVHHGVLKVSRKQGGWFSGTRVSTAAIPNLRVLLAILQQVVGLKVG